MHLLDLSFLNLLKLKIEVRLSDQLPFPIYIVLFVVDGLLIKSLVIIVILRVLIVIVVGHDLVGLLSGRILSEIAVRSQRSLPCHCFDHSTRSNKNRGRDAEKRAESFGLLLRDRALAVDYLGCDSARAEDRLQVYLSEPPNLHVMLQDTIPRRFGDRMMVSLR
jgi:hypothetical protein